MKLKLLVCGIAAAACTACGVTAMQLASYQPSQSWRFAKDYNVVSQCLVASMNSEYQPKSSAEVVFGRNIAHNIEIIEQGRVNHITHEHIAPTTMWMFKVVKSAPKETLASAHIMNVPAGHNALERMERVARSCGGK